MDVIMLDKKIGIKKKPDNKSGLKNTSKLAVSQLWENDTTSSTTMTGWDTFLKEIIQFRA